MDCPDLTGLPWPGSAWCSGWRLEAYQTHCAFPRAVSWACRLALAWRESAPRRRHYTNRRRGLGGEG